MAEFSAEQLKRISFFLFTFNNPKAKRILEKNEIDCDRFFRLDRTQLQKAGFSVGDTDRIRDDPWSSAEEEIEKLKKNRFELVFKDEADFPPLLAQIYQPPEFIYLAGDRGVLKTRMLAVVGSRRASTYGYSALKRVLPDVCRAGLTIVSGMAYGIDSLSHQIALSQKTKTVGINAGGLLHLYPQGNLSLIRKIIGEGAVISEFPLDTMARPFLFPVRNRIIAGVSEAVLVAEATMRSGSLITAKLALEQNRDVLAIPGSIDSPLSSGTNYLIQQGAKLVASTGDILEEFGLPTFSEPFTPPLISAKEKKILDLMGENELKGIDYFVETLHFSASEMISLLMGLILKNLVCEEAGFYKKVYHG